jgi:hypothetical protein
MKKIYHVKALQSMTLTQKYWMQICKVLYVVIAGVIVVHTRATTVVFAQILPPSFEPLTEAKLRQIEQSAIDRERNKKLLELEYGILMRLDSTLRRTETDNERLLADIQMYVRDLRYALPPLEAKRAALSIMEQWTGDTLAVWNEQAVQWEDALQRLRYADSLAALQIRPSRPVQQDISSDMIGATQQRRIIQDSLQLLRDALNGSAFVIRQLTSTRDSVHILRVICEQEIAMYRNTIMLTEEWMDVLVRNQRRSRDTITTRFRAEVQTLEKNLHTITNELRTAATTRDSYRAIVERGFLPLQSRDDAIRFWGAPSSLLGSINIFPVSRQLDASVFTDYYGAWRVGASFSLNLDTASPSKESFRSRFFQTGGEIVAHATLPLWYDRTRYYSITVQTLSKIALHRLLVGNQRTAHLDPGIELYGTISPLAWLDLWGINWRAFRVYGFCRIGTGIGLTPKFSSNIAHESPFLYGQVIGGLQFGDIRCHWIGIPFAPDGMRRPITLLNFTLSVPLAK